MSISLEFIKSKFKWNGAKNDDGICKVDIQSKKAVEWKLRNNKKDKLGCF